MKSFIAFAALPLLALAKTDLEGCTSSETVVYGGASLVYWDPTNGEICSFLDCGGGMAPAKTTVPGCAAYSGTATYSPDYLPGWGSATPTAAASSADIASSAYSEYSASQQAGSSSVKASASATGAGSTLVTSAATLPSAKGTGGVVVASSVVGGNNVTITGTKTPTASLPAATGAAVRFGVAQGVIGVVAGVFGLAML